MYALLLWWWELFRHHQVGAFVQLHRPESFGRDNLYRAPKILVQQNQIQDRN